MNQNQPVVGERTDRGRARPRNEDARYVPQDVHPRLAEQKGYLYAVADGMGGEAGGERASTLAIQTLVTEYYRDAETDMAHSLWWAVQAANRTVYREARSNPALARMGTTLTAAVVKGEELVVAHVGDSRAYLIRNAETHQLTRDHTWVDDALRAGTISPDEARNHPNRHILTRALGADPEVEVDVVREKLRPADRVLLCSDGLTNQVSDGEILQHVQRLGTLKAPDALVDLVNDRGGHDNITAMVISVPGGPAGRGVARHAARRPAQPGTPSRGWVPMLGGLGALLLVVALVFGPDVLGRVPAARAPTPTASPTFTAIAKPTFTGSPAPPTTATATFTATPTSTATPTHTSTATPTSTGTPTPTPVPTKTKTPTPIPYPPPVLIEPPYGASFSVNDTITFEWTWDGALREDEYFDVRVWREKEPHYGVVEWPKDPRADYNPKVKGPGTFFWSVAVIRVRNGQREADLSLEAFPRSFTVDSRDRDGTEGTPVP